ncbi:hypothetical protein AK830_g4108 [Neonectria ditissima]|uniref:Uncharacterized protein n=1 Tax=Neonectria ditissima TaxID=78410 RepID=A0A0P7BM66_9HYPO|nr:hypothetical protein AK830_g4108 [Neonectria ditissima]
MPHEAACVGNTIEADPTTGTEARLQSLGIQSIQFDLPQADWKDGKNTIESPRMQAEYANVFVDNLLPPQCPIASHPNMAFTMELPEYPPVFEDDTIPPIYPVIRHPNMAVTEELPEYLRIFEDAAIPPIYPVMSHPNMTPTEEPPEYLPIFEDAAVPPLC